MDKADRNTGRDPKSGRPVRVGETLPPRQSARQAEAAERREAIDAELEGTATLENTGRDPVQGTPIPVGEIPEAMAKAENAARREIAKSKDKE